MSADSPSQWAAKTQSSKKSIKTTLLIWRHVTYERPNLPEIFEITPRWSLLMTFRTFTTFSSCRVANRHSALNIQQKFPHVWIEKSHSKVCVLPTSFSPKAISNISCVCDAVLQILKYSNSYPQQSTPNKKQRWDLCLQNIRGSYRKSWPTIFL